MGEVREDNGEDQNQLAGSWQDIFDKELNSTIDREGSTLSEVMDVVWNKGILDRLCPSDPAVKQARQDLHRTVYEGERTDSELYWRLVGAVKYQRYAAQKNYSLGSEYVPTVTIAWARMMSSDKAEKFFLDKDSKKSMTQVFEDIVRRSKEQITAIEGKEPLGSPESDLHINFQGAKVKVRYCGDGMIALDADSHEDHEKIGELTGYRGVISPKELVNIGYEVL